MTLGLAVECRVILAALGHTIKFYIFAGLLDEIAIDNRALSARRKTMVNLAAAEALAVS